MSQPEFVLRKNIDEVQWNNCVKSALNSFPYAYTWYLDAVSENWDALVFEDYRVVMPLVWMKKLGVKGLYQPYYCQQLGLFSAEEISNELASQMLDFALKKFSFLNVNLNSSIAGVQKKYNLKQRKNLILELDKGIENVRKNYSQNHKRNIAKAVKRNVVIKHEASLAEFQRFYLQNINPNKEVFKPKHKSVFEAITAEVLCQSKGKIIAAFDPYQNIVAAVLYVVDNERCINLINTSSEAGKSTGAMHLLIDSLLAEQSGKCKIFDFEGSSIASIARFYEGFGATESPYLLLESRILQKAKQLFR